uniref:Predicted protein n=1 Tax=Hordeum vulgare subsp. vulgare TaxID=112509 RepID=F2E5V8_HORVV|nr:predicted protein [Hordeum vulgare subsp. vulgare]
MGQSPLIRLPVAEQVQPEVATGGSNRQLPAIARISPSTYYL